MDADIESALELFVRQRFHVLKDDERFGIDTDLYGEGYVDSMGVVEVLEHLRKAYGVQIADQDLLSDEFSTIRGIAQIVKRAL